MRKKDEISSLTKICTDIYIEFNPKINIKNLDSDEYNTFKAFLQAKKRDFKRIIKNLGLEPDDFKTNNSYSYSFPKDHENFIYFILKYSNMADYDLLKSIEKDCLQKFKFIEKIKKNKLNEIDTEDHFKMMDLLRTISIKSGKEHGKRKIEHKTEGLLVKSYMEKFSRDILTKITDQIALKWAVYEECEIGLDATDQIVILEKYFDELAEIVNKWDKVFEIVEMLRDRKEIEYYKLGLENACRAKEYFKTECEDSEKIVSEAINIFKQSQFDSEILKKLEVTQDERDQLFKKAQRIDE